MPALASITNRRAWDAARKAVLSDAEYASLLAKRVYDLRYACVSTWPGLPRGTRACLENLGSGESAAGSEHVVVSQTARKCRVIVGA